MMEIASQNLEEIQAMRREALSCIKGCHHQSPTRQNVSEHTPGMPLQPNISSCAEATGRRMTFFKRKHGVIHSEKRLG